MAIRPGLAAALAAAPFAALAGCTENTKICSATEPCLTQGGVPGVCVASPDSMNSWCAYEDSSCASGLRWGVLAGDGLATKCVESVPGGPDAGPGEFALTVTRAGDGTGTITSEPGGIGCGAVCSASFPAGTVVTLSGAPGAGSVFVGWDGPCSGNGDCTVTLDQDITVGSTFSPPGDVLWAKRFGGMGVDIPTFALAHSGGLLFASGIYLEPFMIGDVLLSNSGDQDAFIVALDDKDGGVAWVKQLGGPEKIAVVRLAARDGRLAATISFEKATNLGTGTITAIGPSDGIAARLDPQSGSVVWANRIGTLEGESVRATAIDADGNFYFGGSFKGTINLGSGNLVAPTNGESAFVAKFDGDDGALIWAKAIPSTVAGAVRVLDVGPDGDVVAAGEWSGSIETTGGPPIPSNGVGLFFLRLEAATGQIAWDEFVDGAGDHEVWDVDVDSLGYVTVAGRFSGSFGFGLETISATGTFDGSLLRHSDTGARIHHGELSGAGEEALVGVDSAPDQTRIIGGYCDGTASLQGTPISGAGGVMAKLEPDGSLRWVVSLASNISFGLVAVASDSTGAGYGSGALMGTMAAGSEQLSSAGQTDIVIVKFAP